MGKRAATETKPEDKRKHEVCTEGRGLSGDEVLVSTDSGVAEVREFSGTVQNNYSCCNLGVLETSRSSES